MLLKDDKENSTKALWPVIEKQNAAEKSLVVFQESRIIFPSSFSIALSPIIMAVENGDIWNATPIGGTHFSLPWLWEEG